MERIARFTKVSFARFAQDWVDAFGETPEGELRDRYAAVRLPARATAGSAGYDFFAPRDFTLEPGQTVKLPTGVRAEIAPGWFLAVYPRSSLGFKFRLQLNNTVGIIDSDYAASDNEGHIFIKICNDSKEGKTVSVSAGDAFAQGIFTPFGITVDDAAVGVRNGGFGSTNKA